MFYLCCISPMISFEKSTSKLISRPMHLGIEDIVGILIKNEKFTFS